jgi:hypothetical protein
MALSDSTEFGGITIKADGVMEVRMDRIIFDGTDEIARTFRRIVYTPDMDPATLPAKVRRIANVVWDAATVAAYKAAHPSA